MRPTVVLDVVGLTRRLLGEDTPELRKLSEDGATARTIGHVTPAVTCSVQATYLTGLPPSGHGCVGNGWYYRELGEVALWRQAAGLMSGDRLWDTARRRDPSFTVATLFWWYAMYNGADWSVVPRPTYTADGRKIPDVHTAPGGLRDELTHRLGPFPLFNFWGPAADLVSSRWIADAARHVFDTRRPTLTLVYLPHLDYDLQRHGPEHPRSRSALRAIDALCGELIAHFDRAGARVVVLSEYGITPTTGPVHINRVLRRAGLLAVRDELDGEKLDAGASDAFAVADHQVAHVYVRDAARVAEVAALLARVDGVDEVLDASGLRAVGLDHPRSGELVVLARPDRWFTYYYFTDEDRAPAFARTVDIHRKPGYDPCELFVDPALRWPRAHVAWGLAKRALGMRSLLSVVPLDADLVRGSHGRPPADPADAPLMLSTAPELLPDRVGAVDVKGVLLDHVFGRRPRDDRASNALSGVWAAA
jgi:predicted AlkP superfamily pyrophosphatase or phosphodiesterase